jgi:hypothetical protein
MPLQLWRQVIGLEPLRDCVTREVRWEIADVYVNGTGRPDAVHFPAHNITSAARPSGDLRICFLAVPVGK